MFSYFFKENGEDIQSIFPIMSPSHRDRKEARKGAASISAAHLLKDKPLRSIGEGRA